MTDDTPLTEEALAEMEQLFCPDVPLFSRFARKQRDAFTRVASEVRRLKSEEDWLRERLEEYDICLDCGRDGCGGDGFCPGRVPFGLAGEL